MPGPADFAKLVPGFDFLQGLMKTAGQSLPNMGQWIAPTLDPDELEKRIEQLRTVQFWLEQNAKLLSTTIQALEVQRMTLSTLKSMNMPVEGLRDAFSMKAPAGPATPASAPAPAPAAPTKARARPTPRNAAAAPKASAPVAPGIDAMQWWGALTQQFTELAANALKDTPAEAARSLAGQAFKTAVELPVKAATRAVSKAVKKRPARKT